MRFEYLGNGEEGLFQSDSKRPVCCSGGLVSSLIYGYTSAYVLQQTRSFTMIDLAIGLVLVEGG